MDKLGVDMAKSFKKALGIKSPSTVFYEAGTNIAIGAAQGIRSKQELVQSALLNLTGAGATTINFGAGSVTATGGSNPTADGLLLGRGIQRVLADSRSSMALGVR